MVAFAENRFTPTAGSSRPGGLCGKKYPPHRSAETEKYYVRNGYDSPKLGRWLTRDPIGFPDATEVQVEVSRRVTGGTNLYAYVGSSPLGNVDAWGLDVVVLVSPGEALHEGHTAILIGGDASGWDYYSKNGKTDFSICGGNEGRHEHFATLNDFFDAKGHAERYPERMRIPKSHLRGHAVRKYANSHVFSPYRVCSSNCANLVEGSLHAGGIPVGDIGFFGGWGQRFQISYGTTSPGRCITGGCPVKPRPWFHRCQGRCGR